MDDPDEDLPIGVPVLGGERLSAALDASLAALDPDDRDGALAALLGLYARELDGAAAVAARAAKTAREVEREHGADSALYEQVQALQAALSRRQALDKIGARLHAGLVEMLGTPRARAGGKSEDKPTGRGGSVSALTRLRLASGDE